jgi:hypothetical protein
VVGDLVLARWKKAICADWRRCRCQGGRSKILPNPCCLTATEAKFPIPLAVLVGIQTPEVDDVAHQASLEEPGRLVKTLGYGVVGTVSQRRGGTGAGSRLGSGIQHGGCHWASSQPAPDPARVVAASVDEDAQRHALSDRSWQLSDTSLLPTG